MSRHVMFVQVTECLCQDTKKLCHDMQKFDINTLCLRQDFEVLVKTRCVYVRIFKIWGAPLSDMMKIFSVYVRTRKSYVKIRRVHVTTRCNLNELSAK